MDQNKNIIRLRFIIPVGEIDIESLVNHRHIITAPEGRRVFMLGDRAFMLDWFEERQRKGIGVKHRFAAAVCADAAIIVMILLLPANDAECCFLIMPRMAAGSAADGTGAVFPGLMRAFEPAY